MPLKFLYKFDSLLTSFLFEDGSYEKLGILLNCIRSSKIFWVHFIEMFICMDLQPNNVPDSAFSRLQLSCVTPVFFWMSY